ncbi:M56 family metallopeptidase [Falsarthrobacter nasiphocae]|uniref:Zn-dependent protease with chaperone function n=1 Tax=Falsarthrobacter nasiphocae TaxID=189863 RepID=A0AAE4C6A1_9MICC|nr:M48 family metalloprotease [Falsarthrobacter nasiphocae]MDR6891279.1 Zn-dependent protease with chaperone function [Falsarthrobacter nasiphocae]
MILAAWVLAAVAIALAWPVPVLLSRASWPARRPRAAMVVWQGVGLLGGLSMIGAILAWGLAPFGPSPLAAVRRVVGLTRDGAFLPPEGAAHLIALGCGALLLAHLVFTLALTGLRMRARRARHLAALRLVAHEAPDERNRLVVESALPLAYCLPSTGGSITVVTDGILTALSPAELAAVLDHERAHLDQRHDVLIWAFSAWRTALPWLPTARLALEAVAELIEYLADDFAVRRHEPADIARALLVVASSNTGAPHPGLGHSEGTTTKAALRQAAAPASPLAGRTVRRAARLLTRVTG